MLTETSRPWNQKNNNLNDDKSNWTGGLCRVGKYIVYKLSFAF